MNRRFFIRATATTIATLPALIHAQKGQSSRDWSGSEPVSYPDPNVVAIDPSFKRYVPFNTPIQRLHTGTLWAEGPAWNSAGKYLVWSDIPSNHQLRWIKDDSRVSVFRNPSNYSNGNTFDRQGRQLSCEHGGRGVVRYEHDGTTSVIASHFDNKPLNSPNDVVVAADDSIWFTDPPYGIGGIYEGSKATAELPNAVYRVDPASGQIEKMTDDVGAPNGLCFSPDQTKLYVTDTSKNKEIRVWDVNKNRLSNGRRFAQLKNPDTKKVTGADGIRCDADGNIWAGARPGVQTINPNGDVIGYIRLPEVCANICFGGNKRNRLFMTASQSLYAVYLNVQGSGIG